MERRTSGRGTECTKAQRRENENALGEPFVRHHGWSAWVGGAVMRDEAREKEAEAR